MMRFVNDYQVKIDSLFIKFSPKFISAEHLQRANAAQPHRIS